MQIIYFCFCCIWFAFHILKKLWNYCQQTTGSDNSLPVLHTIAMQLASSVRRRCASGDATISVLLLFAGIRCCYLPFLNISIAAARGCTVQRCLPNLLYFYRLSTVRALLHCLLLFKTLLAFGCFPVLLLSFLVSACRLLAGLVWHSFMQIYNSSSAIGAHLLTYKLWWKLQNSLCFEFFRITYFLVNVSFHRHIAPCKQVAKITINHSILQGALSCCTLLSLSCFFKFAFCSLRWLEFKCWGFALEESFWNPIWSVGQIRNCHYST